MNFGIDVHKEVWDARVKIVIGRFIMTGISVFLGVAVFGLILDHFVFNDSGDAFVKPFVIYFDLPITIVTIIVGYVTNYKPKKQKIDAFQTQLSTYLLEIQRQQIPPTASQVNCLSSDSSLGILPNIKYYCFQNDRDLCFFPVRPQIEQLEDYLSRNISYSVVKIPIKIISGYEAADRFTRNVIAYDEKKKPITVQEVFETIRVSIDTKKLQFDKNIQGLLDSLNILPQEAPKVMKTPALKANVVCADDIPTKIATLKKMRDDGLITEEEFQVQKKRLLDQM